MTAPRPTRNLWRTQRPSDEAAAIPSPPHPLRPALRFMRWNGLWVEWRVDWRSRTPEQCVTPGYQPPMQIVRVLTDDQYHEALAAERAERIGRASILVSGVA